MPEQHCQIKQNKSAMPLSLDHVERSRWRRGLAAAQNVPSSAFRLASVIEDLMNKNTGEAFAGQVELAALSAVSERQVREHLEALADTGWINILSGKERTRPKSKRGLHYRPTWPDEATRTRCMDRKYGSDLPSVKSGGKPPVSDGFKTGDITSLNRQSTVSKPAENRRSHSNDLDNDQESGSAQAEAALTNGSYQSNLVIEILSDRSLRLGASRSEFEADHSAGKIDQNHDDQIFNTGYYEPNASEAQPSPDDYEVTAAPDIGDDLDIGGAYVPIVDQSIESMGTPHDPDALTGNRRDEEQISALLFDPDHSEATLCPSDAERKAASPFVDGFLNHSVDTSRLPQLTGMQIDDLADIIAEHFNDEITHAVIRSLIVDRVNSTAAAIESSGVDIPNFNLSAKQNV